MKKYLLIFVPVVLVSLIISVTLNIPQKYKADFNLNIDVKAKQLQWMQADFTINDKFMIINREKDGVNQTLISHSDNATIEGTTMWHRQEGKKWYQRFTVSPQVGAGYGIVNKKFDVYVGVGVGYQFK